MKKVLFITYYWLPSGKASIHWPLAMIKYLPRFNWQPLVLTVKKEDVFSSKDENLLQQVDKNLKVIKTNSYEPFNIYKRFIGKKKKEKLIASETISKTNKSLKHKISIWIRMNLFIPDARIGWYLPGVKEGIKLLKDEYPEAVVSIGPPHTTHLIGMKLSQYFNVDFIPVFIDPWVDIAYYRVFERSKITLAIDNYLEKKVLEKANATIFVTQTMKDNYIEKYNFIKNKSHVLYWGYNEDNFTNFKTINNDEEEIIVHAGNIFDFQNIPAFWKRIKKEIERGRNITLHFIGSVSPGIRKAIEEAKLENYTKYLGFLPYNKMIEELNKATYLLVCVTEKRHIPGKLFEYLRAFKPIIAFGDDNEEVKNIITEANAGMIFNYNDDAAEFFGKTGTFNTDLSKIKKYDREHIAKELAEILNQLQNM